MAFERVEITAEVVKEAGRAAAARRPGVSTWADTKVRCLIIRQRAGAAKWCVKGLEKMRTIGDVRERHPEFLSVKAAREKAAIVYAQLRSGADQAPPPDDVAPDPDPVGWTVSQLCLRYQRMMSQPRWVNGRMKPSSAGSCDDIRLAFSKASYQPLGSLPLSDLNRPLLNDARDGLASFRQREKNVAYIRAAMNWAADKHPDESGLTENVDRWWEHLSAGDPDAETMQAIETRREALLQAKEDFSLDHLAALLVEHEDYCRGRTAADKISPGIRFGLWWVAMTANRRFSTVQLLRSNLMSEDPLGRPGWGRAAWDPEAMKVKTAFWLPLPPAVRDVATGSIADWKQLVANEHGALTSKWVFASTRRTGRNPSNEDVSVYANSINRHLQRMRAAGCLKDLPAYWPHLTRTVIGNFLENCPGMPPIASSLVLAHTLPETAEKAAVTTRKHYLTGQRMDVKAVAMEAWIDALHAAVERLGGRMPAPRETMRVGKVKQRAA